MSQLRERSTYSTRLLPDEAVLDDDGPTGATPTILRALGGVAVLVVGAVHLQQYLTAGFDSVRVIGTLFLLNFAGATVIGLGLLVPVARVRPLHFLFALGGIALAGTSFVFLFVSEHMSLFGFQEQGYRSAIVVALVAEAIAVVALAAYLAVGLRGR
jgi:hypothetical protein